MVDMSYFGEGRGGMEEKDCIKLFFIVRGMIFCWIGVLLHVGAVAFPPLSGVGVAYEGSWMKDSRLRSVSAADVALGCLQENGLIE